MLTVDVRQVPNCGLDVSGEYEREALWEGGSIALRGPVRLDARVVRSGPRVAVTGHAQAEVLLACSLCLEQFRYALELPVSLVFMPSVVRVAGGKETEGGDHDAVTYEGGEVMLGEELRQMVLVALPMKPLCREDCGGICPKCGRDLGREECSCRPEPADPRLAVLGKLKAVRGKDLPPENQGAERRGEDGTT